MFVMNYQGIKLQTMPFNVRPIDIEFLILCMNLYALAHIAARFSLVGSASDS